MTSRAHLQLFAQDNISAECYISFISNGQEFRIKYLIPTGMQISHDIKISNSANSLEEIKKYLIIAMAESEAWKDCLELIKLYQQLKDKNAYT